MCLNLPFKKAVIELRVMRDEKPAVYPLEQT